MHRILVLLALVGTSIAVITDLACTKDGKYTKNAIGCNDAHTAEVCAKFFPDSKVTLNGTDERPENCFMLNGAINYDLRDLAVNACARTCGYCCQTKEYSCNNARNARINCDMVTDRMCVDQTWIDILASDCPATCGFCTLGGCEDKVPGCSEEHCSNALMQQFVQENCKRTCGLCKYQ